MRKYQKRDAVLLGWFKKGSRGALTGALSGTEIGCRFNTKKGLNYNGNNNERRGGNPPGCYV